MLNESSFLVEANLNKNLTGRTALVTGASSGLGMDFARELARLGCGLVLVARREARLKTLQEELIKNYRVPIQILVVDLAEEGAPQRLYERLKAENVTVDVLINNAGLGVYGEFAEIPWERTRNMLELDIVVLSELMHLFLAGMLERNYGYILNLASIGAYQPSPTYAVYSAAKSYVLSLTEAVSYELRHTKVRCTAISPGVTKTEFLQVAGQKPTLYQRIMMMGSARVARIGITAMLKGRPSVVPGWTNAVFAWSMRLIPSRLQIVLADIAMRMG